MNYSFPKAVKVAGQKPPKPRLEYNLIPKQLAKWEGMSALTAIRLGLVKSTGEIIT